MRVNKCITVLLCAVLLLSLVTVSFAADTATLTISPDITTAAVGGSAIKITYTITVTPPAGQEIGVFSFQLSPSGQMTLPATYEGNGKNGITYVDNGLGYNPITEEGVFNTYEYTPESGFFAAVGSSEGNRMTDEAQILILEATVPAGVSGAFVLDAEFTAAQDGSGDVYRTEVKTTPVIISAASGKTDSGSTVVVTDLDQPKAGDTMDTDVTVTTGGSETHTTEWLKDGEKTTDTTFEAGHLYTTVITVENKDGKFDETVYTNQGFTVTRLDNNTVELRRTYQVEDNYSAVLTEDEAQRIQQALTEGASTGANASQEAVQTEETAEKDGQQSG